MSHHIIKQHEEQEALNEHKKQAHAQRERNYRKRLSEHETEADSVKHPIEKKAHAEEEDKPAHRDTLSSATEVEPVHGHGFPIPSSNCKAPRRTATQRQ